MSPLHPLHNVRRAFGARTAASAAALATALGALPGGLVHAQPQAQVSSAFVTYEGQRFDRLSTVAGAELRLNGLGVRQVAWFKGYLVALYLSAPATTAQQAQASPGPKRIQLRMLHEVPAAEFSKALRKGIARNTAPPEAAALQDRTERFVRAIDALGKVRKGDVIDLDLDPARGLLFSVNRSPKAEPLPGQDFYAAVLRSFVGDVPYDPKMRDGLLGKP
jgi:hypothetical protein